MHARTMACLVLIACCACDRNGKQHEGAQTQPGTHTQTVRTDSTPAYNATPLAASEDPPVDTTDFRYQFVAAAKAIRPSLVSITSLSSAEPEGSGNDNPLDFFFRGSPRPEGKQLRRGMGSGVIVDGNGSILTNNHVVANADTLKVTLSDDREFVAKVVGTDPKTDVAVVRIDPGRAHLQSATMGDSDRVQVGEWVMAAGCPFGLRQTVSAGIVSAVGRGNMGITEYEDFIQTDAAVNPGNSGGPLVDLSGRVVGINTAIASPSGGNNGVGFAVPISMAKIVMDQLLRSGKVVRGYLGVSIGDVTPELARSFDYDGTGGVLVQEVSPASPAARAGLKAGDIIVSRDGKPVVNAASFRNAIADTPPGTMVTIEFWRDGKMQTRQLKLGELPGTERTDEPAAPEEHARWGLQLSDLTPELQQRLKSSSKQGAVVIAVDPNSPADGAGLQPGDVITQVGDNPVTSVSAAQASLKRALRDDKPVRLRIERKGHGMFVALTKRQR
jgi:serine protease Do